MNRYRAKKNAQLQKAYDYLLDVAQPDGRIAVTNLPTSNTAVSMLAFATANERKFDSALRRARQFLVSVQRDFGQPGTIDTPFDGGFGYGLLTDKVSDMSNTLLALEAMRFTSQLKPEKSRKGVDDLNWDAAIHFLQSCQNLRSHNTNEWASDDPKNKGGFIYHRSRGNAGSERNDSGRLSWRSYGSISYAGMLSYIYADLKRDDPRLQAVFEWLQNNFTLDENPGMKDAGLYYYYHSMAKALAAYGVRNVGITQREKG